jgi:recombination protein RecT
MTATTALEIIRADVYSVAESFNACLSDRSLNFESEAAFAVQILMANDYAMKIAQQNRQSVVNAVTNVAAIGISLNPAKKQAYLVPRKVGGTMAICLDISYMGLMDLAVSTGAIAWAQAAIVREKDEFALRGFDAAPRHEYSPFATDRGEIVGVYVVAKTASGDFLTHAMTAEAVTDIRDKSEAWKAYKAEKISTCPWVEHFEEMAKKTCVKQASKYWPEKPVRLEQALHYLNTDGGEAITLAPTVNPLDALRIECAREVEAATTADELRAVNKRCVAKFNEAKDRDGYAAYVMLVKARGAALTGHKPPPPEDAAVKKPDPKPKQPANGSDPDPEFVRAMELAEAASHAR